MTSTVVSAFARLRRRPRRSPLTGLDPDVLPQVHRWSAVTGSSTDAAQVAELLPDADHPDARRPSSPPAPDDSSCDAAGSTRTRRSGSGSPASGRAGTRRCRPTQRGRPGVRGPRRRTGPHRPPPSRSASRPTTSTTASTASGRAAPTASSPPGRCCWGPCTPTARPSPGRGPGGAPTRARSSPRGGRLRAAGALPDQRRPGRAAARLGARRPASRDPGGRRRGDRGAGRGPRHVRAHPQRRPPSPSGSWPCSPGCRRCRAASSSPTGRRSPRWSTAPHPAPARWPRSGSGRRAASLPAVRPSPRPPPRRRRSATATTSPAASRPTRSPPASWRCSPPPGSWLSCSVWSPSSAGSAATATRRAPTCSRWRSTASDRPRCAGCCWPGPRSSSAWGCRSGCSPAPVWPRAATRLLGTGPDGRPLTPPLHVVLASAPTALVLVAAVVGTVLAAALTASASLREPALAAPELDLR